MRKRIVMLALIAMNLAVFSTDLYSQPVSSDTQVLSNEIATRDSTDVPSDTNGVDVSFSILLGAHQYRDDRDDIDMGLEFDLHVAVIIPAPSQQIFLGWGFQIGTSYAASDLSIGWYPTNYLFLASGLGIYAPYGSEGGHSSTSYSHRGMFIPEIGFQAGWFIIKASYFVYLSEARYSWRGALGERGGGTHDFNNDLRISLGVEL
ncbi:MAG: hypothetical protein CL946_01195 [Ectothiorhodospiraceae bacterium]|nr:hypothetical protein [Ectothiorhodospiraceae bacterium]